MRVLLVCCLFALIARADSADDAFAKCIASRAKARGVTYAIGRLQEDGHGVQRVAVLSDELVMEQVPGHRWTFGSEMPRTEFDTCGVAADGVFRPWPCAVVSFGDPESAYTANVAVALRDGKPAILRENESVSHDGHLVSRSSVDHDLLVSESTEPEEPPEDDDGNWTDPPMIEHSTRTIVALEKGSKWADSVPLHPSHPTWGEAHWTGPADAKLELRARLEADGRVHLLVKTVDDVRVPLTGEDMLAMARADHVELTFSERPPDGVRTDYHIDVAAKKDGSLVVRSLEVHRGEGTKPERPLPTASGTLAALDLTVPDWVLSGDAGTTRKASFDLEYSDSDDGKKEHRTLVGVAKGPPAELPGLQLVAYPHGDRWPRPEGLREISCDGKP